MQAICDSESIEALRDINLREETCLAFFDTTVDEVLGIKGWSCARFARARAVLHRQEASVDLRP
eukprot:1484842-Amphidinium_carterae.1